MTHRRPQTPPPLAPGLCWRRWRHCCCSPPAPPYRHPRRATCPCRRLARRRRGTGRSPTRPCLVACLGDPRLDALVDAAGTEPRCGRGASSPGGSALAGQQHAPALRAQPVGAHGPRRRTWRARRATSRWASTRAGELACSAAVAATRPWREPTSGATAAEVDARACRWWPRWRAPTSNCVRRRRLALQQRQRALAEADLAGAVPAGAGLAAVGDVDKARAALRAPSRPERRPGRSAILQAQASAQLLGRSEPDPSWLEPSPLCALPSPAAACCRAAAAHPTGDPLRRVGGGGRRRRAGHRPPEPVAAAQPGRVRSPTPAEIDGDELLKAHQHPPLARPDDHRAAAGWGQRRASVLAHGELLAASPSSRHRAAVVEGAAEVQNGLAALAATRARALRIREAESREAPQRSGAHAPAAGPGLADAADPAVAERSEVDLEFERVDAQVSAGLALVAVYRPWAAPRRRARAPAVMGLAWQDPCATSGGAVSPAALAVAFAGLVGAGYRPRWCWACSPAPASHVTASRGELWIGYPGTQSVDLGRPRRARPNCMRAWIRTSCASKPCAGSKATGAAAAARRRVGLRQRHRHRAAGPGLRPRAGGRGASGVARAGAVIVDSADLDKLGAAGYPGRDQWPPRARGGRSAWPARAGGVNVAASLATARASTLPRRRAELSGAAAARRRRRDAVAARLQPRGANPPFAVWGSEEFAARAVRFWLFDTGAGLGFPFGALLVALVGAVITSHGADRRGRRQPARIRHAAGAGRWPRRPAPYRAGAGAGWAAAARCWPWRWVRCCSHWPMRRPCRWRSMPAAPPSVAALVLLVALGSGTAGDALAAPCRPHHAAALTMQADAIVASGLHKSHTTGRVVTPVLRDLSPGALHRRAVPHRRPFRLRQEHLLALLSGLLPRSRQRAGLRQRAPVASTSPRSTASVCSTPASCSRGFNLFPALTALEQVAVPLGYLGLRRDARLRPGRRGAGRGRPLWARSAVRARPSCPAARSSAWPSPAPWPSSRRGLRR